MTAQGSKNKCFKKEKVETDSFLRHGPGNWHSVTSAIFYPIIYRDKDCWIEWERTWTPSLKRRQVKDFVVIFTLPHLPNSAWSDSFKYCWISVISHILYSSKPQFLCIFWSSMMPLQPFFSWLTLTHTSNSSSDIIYLGLLHIPK